MSELRFEGVEIRFGTGRNSLAAVDGVDLLVPDRSVVGLVGESGSGKSTLARAAVGLAPVSKGRILLDGVPLRRPRGRGPRPLQMVFQDPSSSLDPRMTIGDSIAEAIPASRIRSRRDRDTEVARLLDLVELDTGRASQYAPQLSGGQRQRVALARALAGQPRVIIADEITSALDVSVQGTVLNLVMNLQREFGFSMLFISHNLAVVRYVSDAISVMYAGRIVESGPAADVLERPQHPYTRELLAAAPDRRALRSGGVPSALVSADPVDPHHPPPGCRFHTRCAEGPLFDPSRQVCIELDPSTEHAHRAACHFAAPLVIGAPAKQETPAG